MEWMAPSEPSLLDPARRVILDWLLQTANRRGKGQQLGTSGGEGNNQGCMSDRLWHRKHCKLLARVSLRYFDFFKEHLKFLVARTKEMERDTSLGMEVDASETERGVSLFVAVGEEMDDTGLQGMEMDSSKAGRDVGLVMEGGREERGDTLGMEVDPSEVGRRKREGLGVEVDAGTEGANQPSMEEQVAWVTAHWLELVLAGGQVKEVCLSLLLKESQQLSQISQEELTHAECTLTLLPPVDSVWNIVLKAVHSKM